MPERVFCWPPGQGLSLDQAPFRIITLGLLGLLWCSAAFLGWRAFALTRLYFTPLLDLAKLTTDQPALVVVVHNLLTAYVPAAAAADVAARLGMALLAGLVGLSTWRQGCASKSQPIARAGARLLTAILLLATAWFQTWYLGWVWPLASPRPRTRLVPLLLVFNTTAWFKYLMFDLTFGAYQSPRVPFWLQNVAASCFVMAPPLVLALWKRELWRGKTVDKPIVVFGLRRTAAHHLLLVQAADEDGRLAVDDALDAIPVRVIGEAGRRRPTDRCQPTLRIARLRHKRVAA
jgi:hypothetical protein